MIKMKLHLLLMLPKLKELKGDFKTYTVTKLSKGKNYFANGFLQRVYVN